MKRPGRGGPRPLSKALPEITRRAFARRGFAEPAIVTDWPVIVGEALGAHTAPERLVFPRGARTGGTLHIRVDGPFAIELQHLEPLVIERINAHFGYSAVARLALMQGPVMPAPTRTRKPPPRPMTPNEDREISERVSRIDDDSLRQALAGLGRAVKNDQKDPKS